MAKLFNFNTNVRVRVKLKPHLFNLVNQYYHVKINGKIYNLREDTVEFFGTAKEAYDAFNVSDVEYLSVEEIFTSEYPLSYSDCYKIEEPSTLLLLT